MERDAAHPASAAPGPQSPARTNLVTAGAIPAPQPPPPGRPALRTLVGLPLAACIVVAALVFVVLWRRGQADCRPLGAAARFNAIIAAGKSAVCRAVRAIYRSSGRGGAQHQPQATPPQQHSWLRPRRKTPRRQPPAAPPDQTQLLQTIARDLANLERNIEQLKANQQQMASDNSKAIGELKASQEEMKRALAKVSEQTPPKASAACRAAGSGLAQARADVQPPQARARPRYPEGSGSTTIGSRRFGDHRNLVLQQRLDAIRSAAHRLGCHRECAARNALRPVIAFSHLASAVSSHLPISGSGRSL